MALEWCESVLEWRESALKWRESALKWRLTMPNVLLELDLTNLKLFEQDSGVVSDLVKPSCDFKISRFQDFKISRFQDSSATLSSRVVNAGLALRPFLAWRLFQPPFQGEPFPPGESWINRLLPYMDSIPKNRLAFPTWGELA